MIECRCQHCSRTFMAPDSMIGKADTCPACGQTTSLQISSAEFERAEEKTYGSGVARKRSAARRSPDSHFGASFAELAFHVWAIICAVGAAGCFVWAIKDLTIPGREWNGLIFILVAVGLISSALVYSGLSLVLLYLRTTANNTRRAGKKGTS